MHDQASPYPWLMLAGLALTLYLWSRLARRDERLFVIYLAALGSAFVGAKLVYLAAEGWLYTGDPQRWRIWLTGKSILGALMGGYLGVEVAKLAVGYRQATGDFFAFVAPLGIMLGRVGCVLHGCCLGTVCAAPAWYTLRDARGLPRWPAALVELVFNALMLAGFAGVRWWRARQPAGAPPLVQGQLFHVYLMAYGIFRLVHEAWRDTPRVLGGWSGYQMAAVGVLVLGAGGFWWRALRRKQELNAVALPSIKGSAN